MNGWKIVWSKIGHANASNHTLKLIFFIKKEGKDPVEILPTSILRLKVPD